MCGIAGIISLFPDRINSARLQVMGDALAHRGPDGNALWIAPEGQAGFAHRRLAIIDTSPAAAQPMHYLDRYTIVYNGELYNYREIRDELKKSGYSFRTQSDTEVILAAYAQFGRHCLEKFDGMFALAIWDEKEKKLFGARDRMGEKPLFLCRRDNEFLFASEMKALWAAGAEKERNFRLLFNFLTLGYTQNPGDPSETFFLHIEKLPAATCFEWEPISGRYQSYRYWSVLPGNPLEWNDADAPEKFDSLFRHSVYRRLRSDVPVGSSLSGGLDSSAIVATCAGYPDSAFNHHVFTSIFPGFARNEADAATAIAERFNCHQHFTQPVAGDLAQDFGRLIIQQEEPFGSASVFAQYKVFELAARQGVKVLLDGQGADEILAGYTKYFPVYWQQLYRYHRSIYRSERQASGAWPENWHWGWKNRLAAFWPDLATTVAGLQKRRQQRNWPGINHDFVREYGHSYYQLPRPDSLSALLYYNSFQNGLEELLRLADRNSMSWGREVRLPFLNHELVEFAFSLPDRFRICEGYGKWILRKAMSGRLPDECVWKRQKIGFEPPQAWWMEDPAMGDWFQAARRALVEHGIMDAGLLHKKIRPHTAYAADSSDWKYLVAGTWLIH